MREEIVDISISCLIGDIQPQRPQSLFIAASCSFCFDLILTGGLLNNGNLFFGIISMKGILAFLSQSWWTAPHQGLGSLVCRGLGRVHQNVILPRGCTSRGSYSETQIAQCYLSVLLRKTLVTNLRCIS